MKESVTIVRDVRAKGILLLSSILYAGNVIAARYTADKIPPGMLAFVRGVLGIVVLVPLAWSAMHKVSRLGWRDYLDIAVLGFLGITIAYLTFLWGIQFTSASKASIIFATNPALTNILLALFWHARPQNRQIYGIVLSLCGLIIVFTEGSWQRLMSLNLSVSDLVLLLNVLSVALFNTLAQRVMKKYPPLITSLYSLIFGTMFLFPYGVWQFVTIQWQLSWGLVVAVLYMGCLVTGLAVFLNMTGVNKLGSGPAAIFSNLQPVFSIVMAVILLGERLAFYHWVGFAMVIGGVALSIY